MRHVYPVLRAILLGAWIGTAAAALSSIPFGALALPLSLPPGFAGGIALGLLALHLHAAPWTRRLALFAFGPAAVFVSELLYVLALSADIESAFFLAGLATVLSIPGLFVGALLLEVLVGRRTTEGAENAWRARRLERQLAWQPARHAAVAVAALADPSPGVRRVAIDWLASRHTDPFAILRDHLARGPVSDHAALAIAVEVVAQRNLADRIAVEGALLDILERGDWHAQREAATRLGVFGSAHALEPLASFVALGYLAGEATTATRRIRRRLPNAAPGQLSPAQAPDPAGALSPTAEAGCVSHVPFRPRQC